MAKSRTAPSLWRRQASNVSDGRAFAATLKISSIQNTVIETVRRESHTRTSLALATGITYDSLCRHVRLLIEDGVLCEFDGYLAIAPLNLDQQS